VQCLILAGGLGTRMRHHDPNRPKALIEVAGRPFADWQLAWLADQGVTHVVYSIGYLGEQLATHVGDGARWGLSVAYVDEGRHLLGTAGALRRAIEVGAADDDFFVLYGDSYLSVDLGVVEAAYRRSGQPALMTVYRNEGRFDASNAVFADGLVVRYEKGVADAPPEMCWIDYGLSVLSAAVVIDRVPPGARADLADLYGGLSGDGLLAGLAVDDRFFEVGSPGGRRDLEAHLTQGGAVRRAPGPVQ